MTYTSDQQTTQHRYLHDPRTDPPLQTLGASRRVRGHFEILNNNFTVGTRRWTAVGLYLPSKEADATGKCLRILLMDQKQFYAFLTQPDYEVLFGHVPPGSYVPWYGGTYPAGVSQTGWVGPYMDLAGMKDLLLDHEVVLRTDLRQQRVKQVFSGEIAQFRVHLGPNSKGNPDYQYSYELQEHILITEENGIEGVFDRWKRQEAPGTLPLVWSQV